MLTETLACLFTYVNLCHMKKTQNHTIKYDRRILAYNSCYLRSTFSLCRGAVNSLTQPIHPPRIGATSKATKTGNLKRKTMLTKGERCTVLSNLLFRSDFFIIVAMRTQTLSRMAYIANVTNYTVYLNPIQWPNVYPLLTW